jgi:hypothetical protein
MTSQPNHEEVTKLRRELLITRMVAIAIILGCIAGMIALAVSFFR